jgi:hypothetical protein
MTYLVGTANITPVRALDAQACTEQYRDLPWTIMDQGGSSRDRKVNDAGPYAGLEI